MQFVRSRKFKKQFQKIPDKVQNKFEAKLAVLIRNPDNPILNKHNLVGPYTECFSINITGNYRLVLKEVEVNMFLLIAIGTHSQLYS